MLNKEHEILKPFVESPWRRFTFNEIKEYSKKKSDSYIFSVLKKFVKENALREEKAGNVVLYKLNLDSEKGSMYAGMVSGHLAWNRKNIPYEELELRLMAKLPEIFFIFLVTGSYASGKQTKKSDLDVVIICDDSYEPKKIYAELKHYAETSIPPVHLYAFRRNEFLKMLLDKEANYGKEIAKNNLILTGGGEYFRIISEAIKNGFNG